MAGRILLVLAMAVVAVVRSSEPEVVAPTPHPPPPVQALSAPTATTPTFPTFPVAWAMAALEADPEWGRRQRDLNADLFCRQRPERCFPPTTTTTTSPPVTIEAAPLPSTTAPPTTAVVQALPAAVQWRPSVERWRSLVSAYFSPGDIDHALAIIRCESLGDPDQITPPYAASGLFQHLAGYWDTRARRAGWAGADILDPEANIAVAAWLVYHEGWQHWAACEWYADAQGVG